MPERKTATKEAGPSGEKALLERIAALESQLDLLKYTAEDVEKKRRKDPAEVWKNAASRRERSRTPKGGKYTWQVSIPGMAYPVTFQCDTDNEQAAIREFELRFGTRFIINSQGADGNHKIERVQKVPSA